MQTSIKEMYLEITELGVSFLEMGEAPVSEQLEAVDRYSNLFRSLQESDQLAELGEDQLRQLNDLHGRIVERAKELETRISDDMKQLRTKGRAILKYLDILPKRISARRKREG